MGDEGLFGWGIIKVPSHEEETPTRQTTSVDYSGDINKLKVNVDDIYSRIGSVESEMNQVQGAIGVIQDNMDVLDSDRQTIKGTMSSINTTVADLNTNFDILSGTVSGFDSKIESTRSIAMTSQAYGARGAVIGHEFGVLGDKYNSILKYDVDALASSMNNRDTVQALNDIYSALSHIRNFVGEMKGIVDRKEAGIPVP